MKVGFTGTQHGMTDAQRTTVSWLLAKIGDQIESVHHGDCIGADADFHALAMQAGYRVVVHPPSDEKKRAFCVGAHEQRRSETYLVRNQEIVRAVDQMIATPAGEREARRSGTWSTVRYARKAGVPQCVVYPDGSYTRS